MNAYTLAPTEASADDEKICRRAFIPYILVRATVI